MGSLTRDRGRSFGRPLTRGLYACPFLLLVVVWVGRTAESRFPLGVKVAFGLFACGIFAACARQALRCGIETSDAGVTVVSLLRRRFVCWNEVAGFEIGTHGTRSDIIVVCRDGVRLRTEGFRVFGGDPRILEPYVEALTREQANAAAHRGNGAEHG
jgi:hypothetical protein